MMGTSAMKELMVDNDEVNITFTGISKIWLWAIFRQYLYDYLGQPRRMKTFFEQWSIAF